MRVMCIGASIMMGQGVNGGYRLPLEKMLEGAGIPIQFVGRVRSNSEGMTSPFHDGYSGFRIDQVENGVDGTSQPIADGVRELQPDVALVLCGTNDIRQNYALREVSQRLDHLIGVIQNAAPCVRVMVSSLPPDQHYDDAVRRFNAGAAQVVAKRAARGERVDFVDNYAVINPNTDISLDLTHPDKAGYLKIARGWFNALAPGSPSAAFALLSEGTTQIQGDFCLGYKITMKSAATVTDLGIYCAGKALVSTHAVGVFDESGRFLSQAHISSQATLSGSFAYQELEAPLVLEFGRSYFFVSNSLGLPVVMQTNAIVDPLCFDNPRFYFDHNVGAKIIEQDSTHLIPPPSEIHNLEAGLGYFGPTFRLSPP